MALFDEDIKREFPEHNGPEDIETALDAMRKLKRPECDGIALSPVSKAPAQVMILLQVGLRRTIELTEAAIREINLRKRGLNGIALARDTRNGLPAMGCDERNRSGGGKRRSRGSETAP